MATSVRWAKRSAARAIRGLGGALRAVLPLPLRKRIAIRAGKLKARGQLHFSTALLRDLADADRNAFHRFLWSNHLAYAGPYELSNCFGPSKIEPSRRHLLSKITEYLREQGIDARTGVRSVLDLGCSMGYLLRYAETDIFPSAAVLHGLDIDSYAVETGNAYLSSLQSKVKLILADIANCEQALEGQAYDVALCCGALMYLDDETAHKSVASLLRHARQVVGIISLAAPDASNSTLEASGFRPSDSAHIHNIDGLVRRCGGTVVYSRWEPPGKPESSAAYSILALPQPAQAGALIFRNSSV